MSRISLSVLKKEPDLKKVWKHEELDFTPWLAEPDNLQLLGEATGLSLSLVERESAVQDLSVDILCTEDETGYSVIIENQLEQSDHKHLGQIMAYAAGKDARVVIWVVKKARDEHRKAIEWLNNLLSTHEKDIRFFLVEVELWRIGNSDPAVHFTVIERPNSWVVPSKPSELTADKKVAQDFWRMFVECAPSEPSFKNCGFKAKSIPKQYYYNLPIGRSYLGVTLSFSTYYRRVSAGLYFKNSRDLYDRFKNKESDINEALGAIVEWNEGQKDCTMRVFQDCDPDDSSSWKTNIHWLCEQAEKLKQIADQYDKK